MKLFCILIVLAFVAACSGPSKNIAKKENKIEKLSPFIVEIPIKNESQWISSFGFRPEDVSIIVYNSKKKEIALTKNAESFFIPASTAKLLSSYYIKEKLGLDSHFKTQILKNSEDIYLKGDSDPLLFYSHLMGLCLQMKKEIKKFQGKFYYDETMFEPLNKIENEQKDHESYNPGISSLSSDFNLFNFYFRFNEQDKNLNYYFNSPLNHQFKIGAEWGFESAKDFDQWIVPQTLTYVGKESLPYKNPGFATAKKLQNACMKVGLELPEPMAKKVPKDFKVLATHLSLPLIKILEQGFEYSNNLIFELLLLKASQAKNLEKAALKMKEYFIAKFKVGKFHQSQFKNGSGLSHQTKMSAAQMLLVLEAWGDDLIPLLPISGHKGTLVNRLFEPPMLGQVWAKTGSLDYVSTLAGHLFTQKGNDLIFIILINNNSQSKIGKDWWALQAKKLQDELLRSWYISL